MAGLEKYQNEKLKVQFSEHVSGIIVSEKSFLKLL